MTLRVLTVLCITMFFFGNTAFAQDEVDAVYLHNGSKILGTILEMVPNKHIKIRMSDGSEIVYTFDQIEMVRKEQRRSGFDNAEAASESRAWSYSSEVDEGLLHTPYWELGSVLGTPGGINLAVGYWIGLLGTRISGGYFGDEFIGLQGNLGIKLHDNHTYSSVIAVVAGSADMRPRKEEDYYGFVYEINYKGLFIQAGFGVNIQGLGHPRVIGQVGYMYRFLPD